MIFNTDRTFVVGQQVHAWKQRNAAQNYFPGKVVAIHKDLLVKNTHVYAEKTIALYIILRALSCGLLFRPTYSYDIEYIDGRIDHKVSPVHMREALSSHH